MAVFARLTSIAIAATLTACASVAPRAPVVATEPADPLFNTVAALDAAVFESFNNCAAPGELDKHASYFAADVEFYHDTGGVTWSRSDMLANTKKFVCGKYRRELVPDTLKVFPIKNYGAIAQGVHRFCQAGTDACEGMADFIFIWRKQGETWQATRVLSYGHRPAGPKP